MAGNLKYFALCGGKKCPLDNTQNKHSKLSLALRLTSKINILCMMSSSHFYEAASAKGKRLSEFFIALPSGYVPIFTSLFTRSQKRSSMLFSCTAAICCQELGPYFQETGPFFV